MSRRKVSDGEIDRVKFLRGEGMTQKEQRETLNPFKRGEFDTLEVPMENR